MKRDELEETTGSRIRALRGDMTLDAFSKQLDVSRQAVAKWERGEAVPTVHHLTKMAELYDKDIAYIAFGTINPDQTDKVTEAVLAKLPLLSEKNKELILNMVNSLIPRGNRADEGQQQQNQ